MNQENMNSLKELLKEVVSIIEKSELNLVLSYYNTKEEILLELYEYIKKLELTEFIKIDRIKILFAPTSSLQDIAIHSGWGKEFLVISSKVDDLLEQN